MIFFCLSCFHESIVSWFSFFISSDSEPENNGLDYMLLVLSKRTTSYIGHDVRSMCFHGILGFSLGLAVHAAFEWYCIKWLLLNSLFLKFLVHYRARLMYMSTKYVDNTEYAFNGCASCVSHTHFRRIILVGESIGYESFCLIFYKWNIFMYHRAGTCATPSRLGSSCGLLNFPSFLGTFHYWV